MTRRTIPTHCIAVLLCLSWLACSDERGVPGAGNGAGALSADSSARSQWTMYGHDLFNTQTNPDETVLHRDNVAQLEERWRVEFAGGATSQPVVYDGVVYFGGWDGRMYAADAQTGAIRWMTLVTRQFMRSTPFVTSDRVYAAAGGSLVALNRADGKVVFETVLDENPMTVLDGSPKGIDDLVILGAASAENGPVKSDYHFIGAIYALDAGSGALVWKVATTGDDGGYCQGGAGVGVWSTPAFDRELGLMYIGTGQNYEFPAGNCEDSLLAIHYAREHRGERIAWTAQYNTDDVYVVTLPIGLDGDVGASAVLYEQDGVPLVGAGDKAGTYRTFDRRTGEPHWRVDLQVGDTTGIGGVMTTAAVGPDVLYVTSNILLVDGTSTSVLYALERASGAQRWRVDLPAFSFGAITLANGLLYHAIQTGTLYVTEAATGRQLHQLDLANANGSAPTVVDGRVYVSSGMRVTPDLDPARGALQSFALPEQPGSPPSVIAVAPVEPPPPVSVDECIATLATYDPQPSASCSSCLCECNPTAWATCPYCWTLAPCTALFCGAAQEPELASCLEQSCASKLIPPTQFAQNVEAAPCVQRCLVECSL